MCIFWILLQPNLVWRWTVTEYGQDELDSHSAPQKCPVMEKIDSSSLSFYLQWPVRIQASGSRRDLVGLYCSHDRGWETCFLCLSAVKGHCSLAGGCLHCYYYQWHFIYSSQNVGAWDPMSGLLWAMVIFTGTFVIVYVQVRKWLYTPIFTQQMVTKCYTNL